MRVLKQLVKKGPVFGAEIVDTSPVIVENYANYGFDYININLAHSELDLGACAEYFTTCKMWDIAAAVTVSYLNVADIRKAFEMGAQAVIVPGVQTKDDMLRIIGAAKFPGFPGGKRSYSRAVKEAHYGGAEYSAGKYLATCEAVEMVIPLCDSKAFLDNIDEILSVQGIDAVAFNPVDYALGIGAGDFDTIDYERKDLADALQVLTGKCKAAGVEILLPVWPATYEKANKLADCGVKLLEIGSDTRDFAAAASKLRTEKLAPLLAEFDKAAASVKPLKQLVKERPVFGLNVHTLSVINIELYAQTGVDYIMFDVEHTPQAITDVRHMIVTCRRYGVSPIVRVTGNDMIEIRKAYEMGAEGVVIPHIRTKEDAIAAVQAARFPTYPGGEDRYGGKRSYDSNVRAAYYGGLNYDPAAYLGECDDTQLLFFMCEDVQFAENIDEIFSVKGFDGVMMGPYDYGQSAHHPNFTDVDFGHRPDLQNVYDQLVQRIKENGLIFFGPYFEKGVYMFNTLGFDTFDVQGACAELKENIIDRFKRERS